MSDLAPHQPVIEVFTGPHCDFCRRAKAVLTRRNLPFREIDVDSVAGRDELRRRLPHARTIPQIFIAGEHVGGCQDLERIDADGTLATATATRAAR